MERKISLRIQFFVRLFLRKHSFLANRGFWGDVGGHGIFRIEKKFASQNIRAHVSTRRQTEKCLWFPRFFMYGFESSSENSYFSQCKLTHTPVVLLHILRILDKKLPRCILSSHFLIKPKAAFIIVSFCGPSASSVINVECLS